MHFRSSIYRFSPDVKRVALTIDKASTGNFPRISLLYRQYLVFFEIVGSFTMRNFLAALAVVFMILPASNAIAAPLEARIDLSSQTMVVKKNGKVRYKWKISSGRKGYTTPTGRWSAKWLSKHHRSRKYNNAPMPYAVFFHGGYAVHGTDAISRLGRPASHGCIRLHPDNASKFYNLVERTGLKNTRVVITH